MISPSCIILVICFMPTTLGMPNSRETTETCPVIPHSSATMAAAFFMIGTKSGEVFITTRMSPCSILWKSRVPRITLAFPLHCHLQAILPEKLFCRLFVARYFCVKAFASSPIMSSGSHESLYTYA